MPTCGDPTAHSWAKPAALPVVRQLPVAGVRWLLPRGSKWVVGCRSPTYARPDLVVGVVKVD